MSNENVNRRGFLKKSIAASAGATLVLKSFEEQNLLAKMAEKSTDNKSGPAGNKLPFATQVISRSTTL